MAFVRKSNRNVICELIVRVIFDPDGLIDLEETIRYFPERDFYIEDPVFDKHYEVLFVDFRDDAVAGNHASILLAILQSQ
jgi:hypothetical protein